MTDSLTGLEITAFLTIFARIIAASLAGFFVGFERATHSQPAGIRTHMVLSLGACGIMIMSIMLPVQFAHITPGGDPGRIAAQVISGIGFLGAGAIMRFGFSVKGLTTAASMWTTSGIGLIFGAGYYVLGVTCTVMLVIVLHVVDVLESWILKRRNLRQITVVFNEQSIMTDSVIEALKENVEIKRYTFNERVDIGEIQIEVLCKISVEQSVREIFESLKKLGPLKSIRIE